MRWMNRDRFGRSIAILVAGLAVVFVCVWVATGFSSGVTFAIAIGTATAVAILGGTKGGIAAPSWSGRVIVGTFAPALPACPRTERVVSFVVSIDGR